MGVQCKTKPVSDRVNTALRLNGTNSKKKALRKDIFFHCLQELPSPIQVAEQTGISYGTFRRWCHEDPEYKAQCEKLILDSFNYILTLSLNHAKTSVPMCIYLLKCLGGERFHEKTEQVVSVRYENKYNYAGNITDTTASSN